MRLIDLDELERLLTAKPRDTTRLNVLLRESAGGLIAELRAARKVRQRAGAALTAMKFDINDQTRRSIADRLDDALAEYDRVVRGEP